MSSTGRRVTVGGGGGGGGGSSGGSISKNFSTAQSRHESSRGGGGDRQITTARPNSRSVGRTSGGVREFGLCFLIPLTWNFNSTVVDLAEVVVDSERVVEAEAVEVHAEEEVVEVHAEGVAAVVEVRCWQQFAFLAKLISSIICR